MSKNKQIKLLKTQESIKSQFDEERKKDKEYEYLLGR